MRRYGTEECSVKGCLEKHRRNGFCNMHSKRVFRHGDPSAVYPGKQTPEERYAALKARQRKYNQTPKGKAAAILKRHRRRHREGGDVYLSPSMVLEIMERFDYQCAKCLGAKDLTLDHHVPLAKGGKLEPTNVVVLCRKCNGVKADQLPEEFYTEEELRVLLHLLLRHPSHPTEV